MSIEKPTTVAVKYVFGFGQNRSSTVEILKFIESEILNNLKQLSISDFSQK